MRRISANYIYPVSSPPIQNGIVELDDDGRILNVIDPGPDMKETRKLEFFNGILVPGFVNSYHRLERSFLKGKLEPQRGLRNFLSSLKELDSSVEYSPKMEAMRRADLAMKNSGIRATLDIMNTSESIKIKANSNIFYYSLIEVFDQASPIWSNSLEIERDLHENGLKGNMIPCAIHTASYDLMTKISAHLRNFSEPVLSFQNIQPKNEKERFERMGKFLDPKWNTVLVDNFYICMEELINARKLFPNLFWVICPKSSLFIENNLPDLTLLLNQGEKLTIGTGSYASNDSLNILEELKVLQHAFKEVSLEQLIRMATLNGAEAMNIDAFAGSLEMGKTPGLNLITPVHFGDQHRLKKESMVKAII